MKLEKQIGKSLLADFESQNVARLKEWFERFPEAEDVLRNELQNSALKHALLENMWLTSAFLLRVPTLQQKGLQIQTSLDNPHAACSLLVRSHVQKIDSSKFELLQFLHDRVKM